jgi:ABC-type multidrug transport system ATPase subunit
MGRQTSRMSRQISNQLTSNVAIRFEGVSKRYRTNLPLLESISFAVDYGEVVGLFGPSGSGKTTILQMASGLISPDSGSMAIDGITVFPSNKREDFSKFRRSLISYVPQEDYLIESLSVRENIALALELDGSKCGPEQSERVERVLRLLGIEKLAERHIFDTSAGERRRIAIGRGLVRDPKILIADEPTSSLDLETTNEFLKLVRDRSRELKTAFLIASHDVIEVKSVADRIYGIKNYSISEIK